MMATKKKTTKKKGVDEFICPECRKKCKNAQGLGSHRRKAHGVKSKAALAQEKTKPVDAPPTKPNRVVVSDEEMNQAIDEFIMLRLIDPLMDSKALWQKVARTKLPAAAHGKRLTPAIQASILQRWSPFINEELKEEVPIVIEVETSPPPLDWDKELSKIPLPQLFEVVGRRIGNVFENSHQAVRLERASQTPRVAPPKKKAIRVLILGFLPDQANMIEKGYKNGPRFDKRFDLRFMEGKANKDVPSSAEWAINHTKHMSHGTQSKVAKAIGSDRIMRISGGISACLDALHQLEDRDRRVRGE